MEPRKNSTVQELRVVFAKSQLTGSLKSSQEALDLQPDHAPSDKSDSGSKNSLDSAQQSFDKNVPIRSSFPKPTIGPKPTSLTQGTKPGIKNLVAALEGSHGMYTTRNLPKKHGITLKELRESSEKCRSSDSESQVTSKIVKREVITLSQLGEFETSVSESSGLTNEVLTQTSIKENIDSNGNSVFQLEYPASKEKVPRNTTMPSPAGFEKKDNEKDVIRESIVSVDNYVYKPKSMYVRKAIPSKEELGPAPPKPPKPEGMRLPLQETSNFSSSTSGHSSSGDSIPPPVPDRNQNLSPKPPARVPPKPPRALPKQPDPTPPPSVLDESECIISEEEEEEIYNDVVFNSDTNPSSPVSHSEDGFLIPEDDEIYDDHSPHYIPPSLPRHPPPPPPTMDHLQFHGDFASGTSLPVTSNDSSENDDGDAIYEETDLGPEYINTEEAEKAKLKRKKRALKTEKKTLEKIEKKKEKFMRMFNLSGEEIPLDAGTVKNDSKGNKFDLNVVKGETVLILRMENNPSGKWLVKNGNGRVGYVELTNIQVDVESVKSVMVARTSQIISEEVVISPSAGVLEV